MSEKSKSYLRFNSLLVIGAFAATIVVLITGGFIMQGYSLEINDISNWRIKAPRQVENTVATERLREEAAKSVTARFKVDDEVDSRIYSEIGDFFTETEALRRKATEIFMPTQNDQTDDEPTEDIPQTIDTQPKPPAEPIYTHSALTLILNDSQIEYLLDLDNKLYEDLRNKTEEAVAACLTAGIKEETFAKTIVDLKSDINNLFEDQESAGISYDIASSFLEPNLVVDHEATEKLREERRNEVEPIYYRLGQTIVDDGEALSEEAYYALDQLGLISRGYREKLIPIIGVTLFIFIVFGVSCSYIYYNNKKIYQNKNEATLLFVIYMLVLVLARLMSGALPHVFMPILAFVMLVAVLLDGRLAMVLNIGMTLIFVLIANEALPVVIYYMLTGTAMALVSRYANQRNNVYFTGLIISCVSALVYCSVGFLNSKSLNTEIFLYMSYAFLNGFLTVVICMGSLPIWEALFGVVTPIRLLDLTNPDNELLRRLTIEAPGTYHHSLIVANLAETAAYDIKADPNIARVGGYYHDIGKLKYPQYFSENQIGENLHDEMDPYSSVEIITSHVDFGLKMAEERKMPKVIRDIIAEHHGDTLVKYFYFKACKQNPDTEINEADFRYKQNPPQTKEAACVMLADTVEAAVRSMISESKSMDAVEAIIKNLIKDKFDDNQLMDSQFTIKDLNTVAGSFMRVFKGMYHERIPYPKMDIPKRNKTTGES